VLRDVLGFGASECDQAGTTSSSLSGDENHPRKLMSGSAPRVG
jgi:hypothetical protein